MTAFFSHMQTWRIPASSQFFPFFFLHSVNFWNRPSTITALWTCCGGRRPLTLITTTRSFTGLDIQSIAGLRGSDIASQPLSKRKP